MSLSGETIADGAAPRCEDCGKMPRLAVYESGAGFYIGTLSLRAVHPRVGLLPHPRSGPGRPRERRL
jgi:hypothetical protein